LGQSHALDERGGGCRRRGHLSGARSMPILVCRLVATSGSVRMPSTSGRNPGDIDGHVDCGDDAVHVMWVAFWWEKRIGVGPAPASVGGTGCGGGGGRGGARSACREAKRRLGPCLALGTSPQSTRDRATATFGVRTRWLPGASGVGGQTARGQGKGGALPKGHGSKVSTPTAITSRPIRTFRLGHMASSPHFLGLGPSVLGACSDTLSLY
jgi:hypothetical protein